MARKPSTPPSERQHLVTINDLDWNSKLLVPSHLISELDALLGKCRIVESQYMTGGAYALADKGAAGIDTTMARPEKHAFCPDKPAMEEFVAWHNTTHELQGGSNGRLISTYEEWAATKEVTE